MKIIPYWTWNRRMNDKKCVSWWGLQVIFWTFCEILHIGWDKRKQPWFLWLFLWLHHENRLVENFHYYIRNQCVKIAKCGEFDGNLKIQPFGTASLIVFGNFYILIMDEKVLVLCEKWLSKFSSNLYVLRPPESEKMVFTKVSVCLSVCLSVCSRSCAA